MRMFSYLIWIFLLNFLSLAVVTAQPYTPSSQDSVPAQFGRHGALTDQEMEMARAAWQYFVVAYQPNTGLVNSVGSYPSTTLWDTASYVSGLVAAYELGVIDKQTFDDRAYKLIGTLRNLDLFRGELPNKVYNTTNASKANYANEPGEIGFSALDAGRLLVWLRILKERYPYLANGVDNTLLRWNYCNAIDDKGRIFGALLNDAGAVSYNQEGRLGYAEYAAKGFALWGFDTRATYEGAQASYIDIFGVQVPFDRRDPRIFGTSNYVLTESYLLDGLEMGWDLPDDRTSGPGVASQGWRAEFANRIYLAQQRRYEETGILTARSEHQVESSPYFVYDTIFADGYAWNTLDPSGVFQPDRAAVATKAAIGMWALWDDPYTQMLFDAVGDLYLPDHGYKEGIYENGSGAIPLQTANNNGILLAALLYKAQGPALRYGQERTQYWDTAFQDMDVRTTRCLPPPPPPPTPCGCEAAPPTPPMLKEEDFSYCKTQNFGGALAAFQCILPESKPRPGPGQRNPEKLCSPEYDDDLGDLAP